MSFIGKSDYQVQKVYRWERTLTGGFSLSLDQAQTYIDVVWDQLNLKNPPKVETFKRRPSKRGWVVNADATRTTIRINTINDTISQRILLHEMAHSMCARVDYFCHLHDETFVGVYMMLMEKFMNLPMAMLWYSADKFDVKYVKYPKIPITDPAFFESISTSIDYV